MRNGWVGLIPLVAGCSLFTAPDEVREGLIGYPDHVVAEVPAQAVAGEPFLVRVSTWASGCWRRERTEVDAVGLHVTVTPYDARIRSGGVVCTTEVA